MKTLWKQQRCDVEQKVVHEIHALRVDGSSPSIALFLYYLYFNNPSLYFLNIVFNHLSSEENVLYIACSHSIFNLDNYLIELDIIESMIQNEIRM